ncbi:MAG: LecA/PA-IL family lectin [Acidobacteriota bacterium]
MKSPIHSIAVVPLALLSVAVLEADTLVLRNGSRVQGQLVSVRGDVVEFEEYRSGRSRTVRVDRADVVRIEFDDVADRGSGFGPGRPAGLREREVSVNAGAGWVDTGIDVRAGQSVYFEASGRVRWGRDRRDGPEGESNSPYNAARPLPNRPAAALIGRIGSSEEYFFIGNEQGPIRMRASGRLHLGVNDDYLEDNSGSFRVVVYY